MDKNLNGTKLNNDESGSVSGNEGFGITEDCIMKFIQNENLRYIINNIPAVRGTHKNIYLYKGDKNGVSIHDNLLKSIVENLSSLIDMGSKNKTRKYKESLMAFGYSCGIIEDGYTYEISSSNSSLNEVEKCLEEVLEMMYNFFINSFKTV